MPSHDRFTPLISLAFKQQLTATAVLVAEASSVSVTLLGLCRTCPFAEFESVSQSVMVGLGPDADDRLFKTLSTRSLRLEQSNK